MCLMPTITGSVVVVVATMLLTACAAPKPRSASCHSVVSSRPSGWAQTEAEAIRSATEFLVRAGYTAAPASVDMLREEIAKDPDADVELTLRFWLSVRHDTVKPTPHAISRAHEARRDWWVVIFPVSEEYVRKHQKSRGRGRAVYLESTGADTYLSEFEVDLAELPQLCNP